MQVRKISFFLCNLWEILLGRERGIFLSLGAGKYQGSVSPDFSWVFLGFGGFSRNYVVQVQQQLCWPVRLPLCVVATDVTKDVSCVSTDEEGEWELRAQTELLGQVHLLIRLSGFTDSLPSFFL